MFVFCCAEVSVECLSHLTHEKYADMPLDIDFVINRATLPAKTVEVIVTFSIFYFQLLTIITSIMTY